MSLALPPTDRRKRHVKRLIYRLFSWTAASDHPDDSAKDQRLSSLEERVRSTAAQAGIRLDDEFRVISDAQKGRV